MKFAFTFLVIIFSACNLFAQHDQVISQYMFNGLFLNPAYAGSHTYYNASMLYRTQWIKFEGAPQTYIASVDGPIESKNMGLGLQLGYDVVGVTSRTEINTNYAYQLKFKSGKLAFGIKAGLAQYGTVNKSLKIWDVTDPLYEENQLSELVPKLGTGMYYFTDKLYLGLSVPTLLAYQKNTPFNLDLNNGSQLQRHYYLNAGYVIKINDIITLKPSTLVKYLPAAPVQVDLNVNALFYDVLWVGASIRTGDAVVAILEYQINSYFRLGYAYDITLSELRNYSYGSHEIILSFDFGKYRPSKEYRVPKYF